MHEIKGLKKLRANSTDSKPEFSCSNCNCRRYSPCGCSKNKKKRN